MKRNSAAFHTHLFGPLIALLSCAALFGQETGISGRVIDPTNAVIADAKVSVVALDGAKLATLSNGQGLYQFPSLRATQYVLRFEAPGFGPVEKTLTLLVGQVATVDITLQPASTSSTVNVIEDTAVVDTLSSAVAGSVSPAQINNLPLNGRNWLELSMMVPGITRNDVNFSPLGATGSGKLQLNVDGQQMTQNAAGDSFGQPQFSRDAIDQFQIITNRFDATLGRSMQVQVNAQTKAGTNQFHGTGYGYFRNDAFNASDPVAHKVLPFSDQQYGGTVGGPINRDKLGFFFGYEGERQPGTIFTTPIGFGGQTFTFPSQLKTNSYILRADWQIKDNHRLSVRGTGFTWANPFANITGTAHPSRAAAQTRTSYSVVGTWTWVRSASMVNEVKAGFNHFDWDNEALVASQEYRFPSITIGGPYNYPQHFIQNSEQFRDDLYSLKRKAQLQDRRGVLADCLHRHLSAEPARHGAFVFFRPVQLRRGVPEVERSVDLESRGHQSSGGLVCPGLRQFQYQRSHQCDGSLVRGRLENHSAADLESRPSL